MIDTATIDGVIGQDVYDPSGSKIGSASEVYLDDATGQPEWLAVRTGLFGTKQSFLPIHDAALSTEGVQVTVTKDKVKDAPKVEPDGHLTPEEERELYDYYGLPWEAPRTETVVEPATTETVIEPTATETVIEPTATETVATTPRADVVGQPAAREPIEGEARLRLRRYVRPTP